MRLCDRLLSPPSVILLQLRIRRDEKDNSCCESLQAKVKSDSVKSCKMPETL